MLHSMWALISRHWSARNEGIQAVGTILQSPQSALLHLNLDRFQFGDGLSFAPIVQGIQASRTLKKLTLKGCEFDSSSAHQLFSIYQSDTSSVHSLTLEGHGFTCLISSNELANLMRQSRGLKELDFTNLDSPLFTDSQELRILLEGDTPLERFKLSQIDDEECHALIEALPNVDRIKELTLDFMDGIAVPKVSLMDAFQKNSSLVQISTDDYFDNDDLACIALYLERNEQLPRLLKAPVGEVPLCLRPLLYKVAEQWKTGPSLIFHSLVALKDSLGLRWENGCKRHRVT